MSFFKFQTSGKPKNRGKRRSSYDPAQIAMAFKAVREDGMSVYKAARVFGVPESTLRDRHLGLQPTAEVPRYGPQTLFTMEEETCLIEHMTYMSSIGYGYSRQAFLDLAFEFAVILGKKCESDPTFKGSWYQGFIKRWPDVHLAKPEKLAVVRAKATSEEAMDKHFRELSETFAEHGLNEHPERIWNIDESGIMMEHSPPKVLCPKGVTPQAITSPRGKNVTLIGCGNAAGSMIPPYYIFPGKRWCGDLLENTCPGANGEMSETGWSNSLTFQNYLSDHFMKFASIKDGQTHLVIFDGHKSHVSLSLTNWGKDHGIVFYILPPHTSHVSQPLDVGCFGPLKAMYNVECQTFMRQNPGKKVDRYAVGELSSRAYLKAFSPSNLVSSFRKTGIYPLNRGQITPNKLMPSLIYKNNKQSDEDRQEHAKNFLEERKITAVTAQVSKKRKFIPPTITGNLSSAKNTEILTPSKKNDTPNHPLPQTPKTKKPKAKPVSPRPSCSKENVDPDTDGDSDVSLSDDEELCCICDKRMPPSINLAFVIEFAKWANCDQCRHWTHLVHCTKVRVLRRGSQFLCPHCDPKTRV